MLRRIATIALMFSLCGLVSLFSNVIYNEEKNLIYGELIIQFHDKTTDEDIKDMVSRYSTFELIQRQIISTRIIVRLFTYNVKLVDEHDLFLEKIKKEKIVYLAGFNQLVDPEMSRPNDPY